MRVLVTCPPMLGRISAYLPIFAKYGLEVTTPNVVQTLSVPELLEIVPKHDGWIIGDDQATREVFTRGKEGKLRVAVKWGIGTDNVDFSACKDLEIPICNTPNMFGDEVADIAMGYVIALSRETFSIDSSVRNGGWPKPQGISLAGKTIGIIGFGNIGSSLASRALASKMRVLAFDPNLTSSAADIPGVEFVGWPDRLCEIDFLVVTCSLTKSSYHLIDEKSLKMMKSGVRIVNVGRGPIIDEFALEGALKSNHVHSAALDVFEVEPLPTMSYLRSHPKCIFGSHNASNTIEAVDRTSNIAINKIVEFFGLVG